LGIRRPQDLSWLREGANEEKKANGFDVASGKQGKADEIGVKN
jgi:hypothetical protein